jgi:replicative DNA helicase
VLYVAADRPQQARRSMRRMVSEHDRDRLNERLVWWDGPLPFRLATDPSQLATWALNMGAGTLALDSLKDMGLPLAEDAGGSLIAEAMQHVVANGIELVSNHHHRKQQQGGAKPRTLADVYGSALITATAGSVLFLVGEAGDPFVELLHLKQPVAEVGPFTLRIDHDRGDVTLPEAVDLLDFATAGITVTEAAQAVYATSAPGRNQRERVRRRLEKLADTGQITREKAGEATVYRRACVTPRAPQRAPPHGTPHGHARLGSRRAHAPPHAGSRAPCGCTGPPFKGGRAPLRAPLNGAPRLATDDEEALIARLEAKEATT